MNPQNQSPPAQPSQTAQPASPTPASNPSSAGDFSNKVLEPKTLGIIVGVSAAYALLNLIPLLTLVAVIVSVVLTVQYVNDLKTASVDRADNSRKDKVTILMTIDPVIAQAIFYYRLRKVHPNMAKTFNSFGWKVFGTEFVIAVVFTIILAAIFGTK